MRERVRTDPLAVRAALTRLIQALRGLGVSESGLAVVEVVLAELMNNVVEHAYGDSSEDAFTISIDYLGACLSCHLIDSGEEMPDSEPPPVRRHDLSVDMQDLPEGGFGWTLVRDLTSGLHYCREGQKNHLSFCIPLCEAGEHS